MVFFVYTILYIKIVVHCFELLFHRLTTDIQDFKSAFKQIVSQGLRSVTQVIGGGLSLYTLSPKLTYLMLLVLPGVIMVCLLYEGYGMSRFCDNITDNP